MQISQNVAKSVPSLASQLCGHSLPAACLLVKANWGHLWTIKVLADVRQPEKQASAKVDYLIFGYSTHNC